jgi:Dolichyl-phosphate-mannose-protein mannosyltransferase
MTAGMPLEAGSMGSRLIEHATALVERRPRVFVTLLTLAFLWVAVVRAQLKPFWHDEIYTISIASISSIKAIWAAETSGVELFPPLTSIVTHAVFAVTGIGRIAARLPPIAGVLASLLTVFALVRRRSNATAGLMAMLVLLMSGVSHFVDEARGYGLLVGFFSLALFAWSEAASGRRRATNLPLLAVSLAGMVWTHYYAILAALPIAVGELVRWVRTRKPDWGVVMAFLAAVIATLPLYPLVRMAAARAGTYWRHTHPADLWLSYQTVLGFLASTWSSRLAMLAGLGALLVLVWKRGSVRRWTAPVRAHEITAGVGTLMIPIVTIAVSLAVHGAFVPRYVLPTAVGFAMVLPLTVWRLGPRNGAAELIFCGAMALGWLYESRDVRPTTSLVFENPLDARPMLTARLSGSDPVVVTGTLFLQMWFYAPSALKSHLYYVADPESARRLIGSDTLDRDYLGFSRWFPIQVREYRPFVASQRRFVLYAVDALTWLPARLRQDGAEVHEIAKESWATMYEVTIR